jgi:hypothetical protein
LAVFHAVRPHLQDFQEMAGRTLRGQKAMTDLLVGAHSLPSALNDDGDGIKWLAHYWIRSLQLTSKFPSHDDQSPRHTESVLKRLLEALPPDPDEHDPLGRLFARVCQESSGIYQDSSIRTRLLVRQIRRHPGGRNDPYGVTASTRRRPGRTVDVQLSFCLREFGPETYAVLPMVMVHECVCHVYSGHSEECNESIFAEGFMDWAAQFFFTLWILKIDNILEPAARYYATDFARLLPGRSEDGRAREIGHSAARNLNSWFKRIDGLHDLESGRRVARFAVELNASNRELAEKDALVDLIFDTLDDDFPQLLDQALRRWVHKEAGADDVLDVALALRRVP